MSLTRRWGCPSKCPCWKLEVVQLNPRLVFLMLQSLLQLGGGRGTTHSFTVRGCNLMHLNKENKQDIYLLLIVLLALS